MSRLLAFGKIICCLGLCFEQAKIYSQSPCGLSAAKLPIMIRFWQMLMVILAALVLALLALPAQAADGSVVVDARSNALSLSAQRSPIVSEKSEISVLGPQEKDKTVLKAQGAGPKYYWSLFSLRNNENVPLDFILAIEPQRFPGSGIWPVASVGPQILGGTFTRDGTKAKIQMQDGVQTISFRIPAKDLVNIAVETTGPQLFATLWKPENFQNSHLGLTLYKGLVAGMVLLMLVGLLGLFSVRPSKAAVAGLAFAVAMTIFVEADIGVLVARAGFDTGLGSFFQPFAESLLVAATSFCVATFVVSSNNRLGQSFWKLAVPFMAFANVALALAEPSLSSSLARVSMFLVVSGGFGLSLLRHPVDEAGRVHSRLFWAALAGWVVVAFVVMMQNEPREVLGPQFAAVCALLLVVLCVALLRMGSAQGLAARPFINDATLRSLALSSGRHVLWNWQPATGSLEVGKELGRMLDLPEGIFNAQDSDNFKDIIHPLDLQAYRQLAERADLEPGERVTFELRLRQGDNSYRWFELQARAVANASGTVDRCIGTLTDIGRLKDVEERLATDSLQDQLTGLATKGLLLDRIARSLANPRGLAPRVVVIDVDRFKLINEGLGHETGDRILKTVGARLQDLVLNGETLARLAGGQFALMAQESKARGDFKELVLDIEKTVTQPIDHGGQQIVVTASVGVSPSGKTGAKPPDLLDQAQVAMLEARADGGSKAVFYHTEMRDDRARLLTLEGDLRRGIAQNEITIYYQPIVYLGSLEVAGFEALARWQHPELGVLEPSEFVEVAETAGMMREIGLQMLQGAARQLGIWQRLHRPGPSFFVSVNVSASQLTNPDFPAQVQQVLQREGVDSGSLKLEITETVLMRQPERSAALLKQLRALGVGLACDDFGTGYSSLSSLRDFPFDTLKMDRSFIDLEHLDERNARIIASITSLAHGLNMSVVAEGVETQEQIDRLAELGVVYGQGYFLGRPETVEAANERLQRIEVKENEPVAEVAMLPPPRIGSLYAPLIDQPLPILAKKSEWVAPKPIALEPAVEYSETDLLPSIFALTPMAKSEPVRKVRKKAINKSAKRRR